MQFKHTQIIDVPAAYLFSRLTNFKRFEDTTPDERFALKRQGNRPIHIGTRWDVSVKVRGQNRSFVAELSEMIPPRTVSYKSSNKKYTAVLSISVVSLDAEQCRIDMLVVAKSRSFATGLIFNSIRLARRRINKRMNTEVKAYAENLGKEYRAAR